MHYKKFNELWKDAVDVRERYIDTIQIKTWLNNTITPYELYLKFLYEYFKEELSQADEVFLKYLPQEFKKLEYQEQAVLNARKILLEYGGVFISDVVGLGKTYISAMLAGQLDGRTLVIAPPVLLERSNPGSWTNVFSDFRVPKQTLNHSANWMTLLTEGQRSTPILLLMRHTVLELKQLLPMKNWRKSVAAKGLFW